MIEAKGKITPRRKNNFFFTFHEFLIETCMKKRKNVECRHVYGKDSQSQHN